MQDPWKGFDRRVTLMAPPLVPYTQGEKWGIFVHFGAPFSSQILFFVASSFCIEFIADMKLLELTLNTKNRSFVQEILKQKCVFQYLVSMPLKIGFGALTNEQKMMRSRTVEPCWKRFTVGFLRQAAFGLLFFVVSSVYIEFIADMKLLELILKAKKRDFVRGILKKSHLSIFDFNGS